MKKIWILLSIGILILTSLGTSAAPSTTQKGSTPQKLNPLGVTFEDELDQSMTTPDGALPIGAVFLNSTHQQNLSAAQSFIPRKEVLTRVLLLMAKNATATYPCTCDLRENLTGENLASVNVTPDQFKIYDPENQTGNLTWVEFDFCSVWVTPGKTYYMVLLTANVTNNFYWCAGNGTNVYPNGSAFYSLNDGHSWQNLTDSDACFKTYGVRETVLAVTMKKGLLGYSFVIKNVGNYSAGSVISNISATGGILGLINASSINIKSDLAPGDQFIASLGIIFGLGKVSVSARFSAINAKEQSLQLNATLILFFWLIT